MNISERNKKMSMAKIKNGYKLPAHMVQGTPEFYAELDKRVTDVRARKTKGRPFREFMDEVWERMGVRADD